ncbi:MAG TPA: hypothetical protein VMZ26_05065 [Pyrinomonadaceae bacterium]|nr:hypothetical protein [Pyrinomonadaceae bacterium]
MDPMLQSFETRFAAIHHRTIALLRVIEDCDLFRKPRKLERSMVMFSCGEYILRSAAAVEQTCGGITTRLWDDPFEWTLPEQLSTTARVIEYVEEVEVERTSAFRFFDSDDDLRKQIPAPEALRSIFDLLLDTVGRAEHYQGRAFAVFQMLSEKKLPRM